MPNPRGSNQHSYGPLTERLPNLREILQGYVNNSIPQNQIPMRLQRDHGVDAKLRTVQKYMHDLGVLTARRNGITLEEQAVAINTVTNEDPRNCWGYRRVKEKLGLKGIHIRRDGIMSYRAATNGKAAKARNAKLGGAHPHGIWSAGPNEEWCVDGHEKIAKTMGIAVWGIADKASRMELGLWAMPNARIQDLPPALYLRLVKKVGGMPLSTSMDKGTELGKLISLVKALRGTYHHDISEKTWPSFKAVKSTSNITRERNWHPIWDMELSNVLYHYEAGKIASGFQQGDSFHVMVSFWLWGKIVQARLDELLIENPSHKVRKEKGILLPSGVRHIDIYEHPEDYDMANCLLPIPADHIDKLLDEYDRPDLLQFGTNEEVAFCEEIYLAIGAPVLQASLGWGIFVDMINYCVENSRRV